MNETKLFDATCKVLDIDASTISADLHLITADEIRELNDKHRGKDAPTDVLSFPLTNYPNITEVDVNPVTGKVQLGDIVICKEFVKDSIEYCYVHGLLHLLGYAHETDETLEVMHELTCKILDLVK